MSGHPSGAGDDQQPEQQRHLAEEQDLAEGGPAPRRKPREDGVGARAEQAGPGEPLRAQLEGTDTAPHPTLEAFAREHVLRPGHSYGASFPVGLAMLLDGVEALPREV